MTRFRDGLLCAELSRLLAYPGPETGGAARRALALAAGRPAARALGRFAAAAGAATPAELEELYTATFDLRPACTPYLGVHLLGDQSPRRGAFLARLAGIYAAEGYRPREELGDHLAEVLGFLAVASPGPDRDDLLRDGLLPALGRMLEGFPDRDNPYRHLLEAVGALLEPRGAEAGAPAEEVCP
jgi:nitrate reductase delta subunit